MRLQIPMTSDGLSTEHGFQVMQSQAVDESLKPSTSSTTRDPRQWAGRRKVKASSQRDIAANKIVKLAEDKKAYYEEKMKLLREDHALLREEHALRMEVLQLEKDFYTNKLSKSGEE